MTKRIAALLAAVLVFSMGTTVFAASPSTDNTSVNTEASVAAQEEAEALASGVEAANVVVNGQNVAVTISSVSPATVSEAKKVAEINLPASATVLKVVDVSLPVDFEKVTLTFEVSGVKAGQKVTVLHMLPDHNWEILPGTAGNGTVTATFTSLSPVAFVVGATSPKTGETLPVFALLAVICLAGTVVCTRKVKFN